MAKKYALLIGVSDYEYGLTSLPNATKDVRAVERIFLHPEMGGFSEADVKVLENPDRQWMEEAIETLFAGRAKDDLVLLYFSGHGIKDDTGRLYLGTRTTRKTQQGELVRSTAVPSNFMHDSMARCRSRRQIVILDCCFSGAFAEGLSAKDDGTVDIRTQLGGEGRAILASSTSTQYSFEQQSTDLSIYTRYLVEGIETGVADQDRDGFISAEELHEFTKRKVQEAMPAMKPEFIGIKEGSKIYLAKAPAGDAKQYYRREVERFADRGEISSIGQIGLEALQRQLEVSLEDARQIEAEVLEPARQYKRSLQQYEQQFREALQRENPLSQHTRNDLKFLQKVLGLRDEDISPIESQLIAEIEAAQATLAKQPEDIPRMKVAAPPTQPSVSPPAELASPDFLTQPSPSIASEPSTPVPPQPVAAAPSISSALPKPKAATKKAQPPTQSSSTSIVQDQTVSSVSSVSQLLTAATVEATPTSTHNQTATTTRSNKSAQWLGIGIATVLCLFGGGYGVWQWNIDKNDQLYYQEVTRLLDQNDVDTAQEQAEKISTPELQQKARSEIEQKSNQLYSEQAYNDQAYLKDITKRLDTAHDIDGALEQAKRITDPNLRQEAKAKITEIWKEIERKKLEEYITGQAAGTAPQLSPLCLKVTGSDPIAIWKEISPSEKQPTGEIGQANPGDIIRGQKSNQNQRIKDQGWIPEQELEWDWWLRINQPMEGFVQEQEDRLEEISCEQSNSA